MKHSEYQIIVDNIARQIEQCETVLSKYNLNARDTSKMTIKDLNESILSCRTAVSEMDKFVKDDLYHIIGMADLNAAQTSHIIFGLKVMWIRIKQFSTLVRGRELLVQNIF